MLCRTLITILILSIGQTGLANAETTYLDPTVGEAGEVFRELADDKRIQSRTRYVEQSDQDWFSNSPQSGSATDFDGLFTGINGLGIILVVGAIGLLVFLFLKFGGAGGLLHSDPQGGQTRRKKVKAWGLSSDDSEADIMAQVRAMTDRRAALILLLRHCLLRAASETETNFRRADTERDALRRLPKKWRRFPDLGRLLHRSELVHYGGRDISDESFSAALTEGELILGGTT